MRGPMTEHIHGRGFVRGAVITCVGSLEPVTEPTNTKSSIEVNAG